VATKYDVRKVRDEIRSEIARLDRKIEAVVRDLTIRMVAIAIVLFAALAIIKFFR
jgi:hypothetical protein